MTFTLGGGDDEDVFSEFVVNDKLRLIYYEESFVDIIGNVTGQLPSATIENINDTVNYYRKNDNFMDF